MDMDDLACLPLIPFLRPIFDGIIADGDEQIGRVQKTVAGLISDLADPTTKVSP
jgi:hypothetical protein